VPMATIQMLSSLFYTPDWTMVMVYWSAYWFT